VPKVVYAGTFESVAANCATAVVPLRDASVGLKVPLKLVRRREQGVGDGLAVGVAVLEGVAVMEGVSVLLALAPSERVDVDVGVWLGVAEGVA